ncbi:MAG: UDP-N-acetylmuramoyl-tripeptide--D-alanyl-D-alanine ligase, partial [Firmicutes bacterium]|nr:UDP-N-acetylmuramoyl-tripeptide--D-alanyl-D-alanine ligase [Bacillota bacterium]
LTNIVHPDIAVITNAGTAHIENLGSREGILKAKCEIFEGLKSNGLKILNLDNDMLATVKAENVCFYSISDPKADIYASDMVSKGLKGTEFTINTPKGSFKAKTLLPGEHIVSNALAAAAVGYGLGINFDEIAAGIRDFVPTSGRMDIIDTPKYTVINGAYNANPDSMRASIEVLKQADTYKCAILGDMFELGDYAADMHKKVGEEAAELDMVIAIGELSRNIYEAAGKNALYFASLDEFFAAFDKKELIPAGASVLVKASHSMHFEKIVEKLEEK